MNHSIEELRVELKKMFPEASDGEVTYAINCISQVFRKSEILNATGSHPRTDIALTPGELYIHAPNAVVEEVTFGHGKYTFWFGIGQFI